MIRAVLDTNIFVSALLQPQGPPAQVFLLAVSGSAIQLCVSGEIYAEYEEVIRRPRLKRSQSEINNALEAVRQKGFWVRPSTRVHACADPDDNIFLECAVAAQAEYLVIGNLKDFPSIWTGTRIVTARQFLETISEIQDQPGF
jgi:putative PIN family toxin of toxin-antitoxin system